MFVNESSLEEDQVLELRRQYSIVDTPGQVVILHAQIVDGQIQWWTERMKEGYCRTLQTTNEGKIGLTA